MSQTPSTWVFGGGMDASTSPLVMAPGRVMSGMNYEVVAEGYRRMDGIERFDGRTAPSAARFWSLPFDNGIRPIAKGNIITGVSSGATGRVVLPPQALEGDWLSASASGVLVLTNVTGEFIDDELIYVTGQLCARVDGTAALDGAPTVNDARDYTAAAMDYRRALIGKVPGSGPVRGVAVFDGEVYAWRDNAAETAGAMWRATPAGWAEVALPHILRFTAGLHEIEEGGRIYGALSGAAATAARVVRRSGDWGSTAAGYIVLTDVTGSFGAESILFETEPSATVTADTPIVLPKGGRYMTVEHNFYGSANRKALYGVSGVGHAFEFHDGVYAPIETGTAIDKPNRVFEIAEHLGLIFDGGSVQLSAPGEPLIFDAVQGSVEIGFGTDITDVVQANDSAAAIFGKSKIGILSGRDADTFQLSELTEEAGADAWTAQRIARTLYIDARGLRDLAATQTSAGFRAGSLIAEMAPFFSAKRKSGAVPVLSFTVKGKSQYRVIWSDGTGLSVFMGRKSPEPLLFSVKPLSFSCAATGELADGEAIFCGAADGYVYRLDSGPSLDGAGIQGFVMPPFNHIGSTMQEKRLHKTTVEMDNPAAARIGITVVFDYGDDSQPIAGSHEFWARGTGAHDLIVSGGGGLWDTALWNQFFWSAPIRGKAEAYTEGMGVNMAPIIACESHAAEPAHTLQAYTFHWSPRKVRR